MSYSNRGADRGAWRNSTHKMLNSMLIGGVGCLTVALTSVALSAAPTLADSVDGAGIDYSFNNTRCLGSDTVFDNKLCLQMADTSIKLDKNANNYSTNSAQLIAISQHSYGMVLTMKADNSNLVNESDPTQYISSTEVEGSDSLAANQWGVVTSYGISKDGTTNMPMNKSKLRGLPKNGNPMQVFDVDPYNNASHSDVTGVLANVMFEANISGNKLKTGTYSTYVTYSLTAKPRPNPIGGDSVCRAGDSKNDCQVDLDDNMIPVKYTGNNNNDEWTSIAYPESNNHAGEWYDYNQKRWANAVTVKPEALSKYKNHSKVVDQSDVLGFWVYVPRYAYEVMRKEYSNYPITEPEDFQIHFEKATDTKHTPGKCLMIAHKDQVAPLYRDDCSLIRTYVAGKNPDNSTWATHPAFTLGSKELNGFWIAKFEPTGDDKQPTFLPGQRIMTWDTSTTDYGRKYTTSTTVGVKDSNNVGGNTDFTPPAQNNNNLAEFSSRMIRSKEWGAVAYLSSSKYGAGVNKVQPNAFFLDNNGANLDNNKPMFSKYGVDEGGGRTSYMFSNMISGCGPANVGDFKGVYNDYGTLGTQNACSRSNPQRSYNGSLGQLASTTGNIYGVYDMVGGGSEYVAATYGTDKDHSFMDTKHMQNPAVPPYVDIFVFTKAKDGYNISNCTWEMCGGQGIHEVNVRDDGGEDVVGQWGANGGFVSSNDPLYLRGDSSYGMSQGINVSLFASSSDDAKDTHSNTTFRVVMNK